jgi:hypothetical protein
MSMIRTLGSSLLVSMCMLAIACGGDDDDDGAGKSAAGKGGSGSAGKGAAGSSSDPQECSPMMAMMPITVPAGCTQAQLDEYTDCFSTSCEPTFEACYGPDYRDGTYAGPCKAQIECATETCDCDDTACMMNCPGTQMCVQCITGMVCGRDCKIPTCGLDEALRDSGISLNKTCDDVLACCATLAAEQMQQCMTTINMVKQGGGANADLVCSGLLLVVGAGSTDPACM